MKNNYVFIAILGVFLTLIIHMLMPNIGKNDFLAYWSASNLLITGGNPYDQEALRDLELSTQSSTNTQGEIYLTTWNPPWLLLLLAPIGWLSYNTAATIWMFCNIMLIGLTLILSWQLTFGLQQSRGMLFIFVIGYLFGETISYLAIGQITSIVLISMVFSIWLIDRQMDYLAGISLLLSTIKPHISYFFLIILCIWIIKNHRWNIFLGFFTAIISSLLIISILSPNWVQDYIKLFSSMPYRLIFTSTLGSFMYSLFRIRIFYFSAIALLLFIKPMLDILEKEGLITAMNIALLISLPLAPFGFNFDQIVILPSIVQIIAWIWRRKYSRKIAGFLLGLLLIFYAFVLKMLSIDQLEYYWFFIVPIIFFPIYLMAWKMNYENAIFYRS